MILYSKLQIRGLLHDKIFACANLLVLSQATSLMVRIFPCSICAPLGCLVFSYHGFVRMLARLLIWAQPHRAPKDNQNCKDFFIIYYVYNSPKAHMIINPYTDTSFESKLMIEMLMVSDSFKCNHLLQLGYLGLRFSLSKIYKSVVVGCSG